MVLGRPLLSAVFVFGAVFTLGCFSFFFFFVFFFFAFGFLASWLFGFLAFWLLGFLAFRLLVGLCGFWWLFGFGFSRPLHSQFLFGRWRFGFCGFSLVYAAFGGFGFSHPLLSLFLSGRFGFCTLSLVFRFGFPHHQHHQFSPYLNHHFFEHHGGAPPHPPATFWIFCRVIAPLFESTLLEGAAASPQPPPLLF